MPDNSYNSGLLGNIRVDSNTTKRYPYGTKGFNGGKLEGKMSLLMRVPPNLVQSIRAYRTSELQKEAGRLGHHFLYAHCAHALTKQQVCARIGEQFTFPRQCSKNFEALRNCITNVIAEAGPQPGFIAVLDQLPNTQKFDKEARETLLDVFRDAAEFWAEKKVPFRVFYSFEEPQSPQSVGWVGARPFE
jgi:hypothetical protein